MWGASNGQINWLDTHPTTNSTQDMSTIFSIGLTPEFLHVDVEVRLCLTSFWVDCSCTLCIAIILLWIFIYRGDRKDLKSILNLWGNIKLLLLFLLINNKIWENMFSTSFFLTLPLALFAFFIFLLLDCSPVAISFKRTFSTKNSYRRRGRKWRKWRRSGREVRRKWIKKGRRRRLCTKEVERRVVMCVRVCVRVPMRSLVYSSTWGTVMLHVNQIAIIQKR